MKLLTYNIHKGLSPFGSKLVVHGIRQALHDIDADLVFLQEVAAENRKHENKFAREWPKGSQHEFIASDRWLHTAYGETRNHRYGHHGNAILSKHPISNSEEFDMTVVPLEKRAMLYCEIQSPDWPVSLHCFCVHLSLLKRGRERQYRRIAEIVKAQLPDDAPLIIAGDFNDWRSQACRSMAEPLQLHEVHVRMGKRPSGSFPVHRPTLPLDRIYVRGLEVLQAEVLMGKRWEKLSDHAPLSARVRFEPFGFGA
jgi:endonuclease/exonuclease/phosphatase family metal-dependent hydrolase